MINLYNVDEEEATCLIKILLDTLIELKSQLHFKILEMESLRFEYENEKAKSKKKISDSDNLRARYKKNLLKSKGAKRE